MQSPVSISSPSTMSSAAAANAPVAERPLSGSGLSRSKSFVDPLHKAAQQTAAAAEELPGQLLLKEQQRTAALEERVRALEAALAAAASGAAVAATASCGAVASAPAPPACSQLEDSFTKRLTVGEHALVRTVGGSSAQEARESSPSFRERRPSFRERRLTVSRDEEGNLNSPVISPRSQASPRQTAPSVPPRERPAPRGSQRRRRSRMIVTLGAELTPEVVPPTAGVARDLALDPAIAGTFSCHGAEPDAHGKNTSKINQDCASICCPMPGFDGATSAVFCVLDGHGARGREVSQEALHNLHHELERRLTVPPHPHPQQALHATRNVLVGAFEATQRHLAQLADQALELKSTRTPAATAAAAATLAAPTATEAATSAAAAATPTAATTAPAAGPAAAPPTTPPATPAAVQPLAPDAASSRRSSLSSDGVPEELIDASSSGACALVAILEGAKLSVASAGDCRAVVGVRRSAAEAAAYAASAGCDAASGCPSHRVLPLSHDHRPDSPNELMRIEAAGGYVRPAVGDVLDEDYSPARVFQVKGKPRLGPGVCMSRSLGDLDGSGCGMLATPDVTTHTVDPKVDDFLILASDGVWEFVSSEAAVRVVAAARAEGKPAHEACRELIVRSALLWKVHEGDYRDDITAVVLYLPEVLREMEASHKVNTNQKPPDAIIKASAP